jgi:hypothetical protein
MRRDSLSTLIWSLSVVALFGFVEPIGAIPLESWDSKIPNAGTRFKVLSEFNDQAVLDKETQLVWEQLPAKTLHDWNTARFQCTSRTTGGRKGWRLPSVHELNSLIDPSVSAPGPALPPGHPFANFPSSFYWSATTVAADPTLPDSTAHAWAVHFGTGFVGTTSKGVPNGAWCVRGGMNADQY